METLTITLRTREDAYNWAIKFGASELLAACIASECKLPRTTLGKKSYENTLSAFIIECFDWEKTDLGFGFWNSLYSSLITEESFTDFPS